MIIFIIKNSIGVILDVINEYKYKEQVEDIFEDKYVIQVSMDLINRLLEKETEGNPGRGTRNNYYTFF